MLKEFENLIVQRFLIENNEEILSKLPSDVRRLAMQQRDLRKRAIEKLPLWGHAGVYIPGRTALEQCTSEAIAKYRAGICSGKRLLNLSGGMGVDDWALAKSFGSVYSIEISEEINEAARYNFQKLGVEHIKRITGRAEDWLLANANETFDVIYADPDRRVGGKRSALWADASPDMESLLPGLLNRAKEVWVKSSPLTNPDEFIRKYGDKLQVQVIEERGEVKEILYRFASDGFECNRMAVMINKAGTVILNGAQLPEKEPNQESTFGKYLMEPSPAIIKAGLARRYAAALGLSEVYKGNYWFTAAHIPAGFSGRVFEIGEALPYKPKTLKGYFNHAGISKAMIAKRQFPHSVAEIRDTFKLKDGDETFLLFTTDKEGLKIFIAKLK